MSRKKKQTSKLHDNIANVTVQSETLSTGLEKVGKILQQYNARPKIYKPNWCSEIGDFLEKHPLPWNLPKEKLCRK